MAVTGAFNQPTFRRQSFKAIKLDLIQGVTFLVVLNACACVPWNSLPSPSTPGLPANVALASAESSYFASSLRAGKNHVTSVAHTSSRREGALHPLLQGRRHSVRIQHLGEKCQGTMVLRGGGETYDWRPESFGKEYHGEASRRKTSQLLARSLRQGSERGNVGDIRHALDRGADVNVRDCAGFTPLHVTAERGFVDAICALIDRVNLPAAFGIGAPHPARMLAATISWGAAVDAREDITGRTALHIAAHEGRELAVEKLLELGADMEARDHAGSTPFLVAARTGNLDALKKLAEYGCNSGVTDSHGDDAVRLVQGNARLKPETRKELQDYLAAIREV